MKGDTGSLDYSSCRSLRFRVLGTTLGFLGILQGSFKDYIGFVGLYRDYIGFKGVFIGLYKGYRDCVGLCDSIGVMGLYMVFILII